VFYSEKGNSKLQETFVRDLRDLYLGNFLATTILDISLMLLCNNDGSVGIACSSPCNIFIHVIPEDGPYGPKHVVTIIRA
jgi:hypothetical protein